MKKQAMIYAVKDSLILLLIGGGITFGIFAFVANSYGKANGELALYISLIVLGIMGMNIISALGASMLLDTSYEVSKDNNTIRVAILNEDKVSSTLHLIKVLFYLAIGLIFYPFALIVTLLNMKELFKKDEVYENKVKEEKILKKNSDDNDITVKGNKKWKIKLGVGEEYYFHTSNEGLDYAFAHKISPRKVKAI